MTDPEFRKVYYISPRRRGVLLGIWLMFTVFFVGGAWYASDPALLIVGAIVGLIIGSVFAIAGWWYPRLVVDTGGIALCQLGWSLSTTWENVAAARLIRGSEGLILRQPLNSKGANTLAAFRGVGVAGAAYYGPEQQQLIAERRFIPLEAFEYWFRHGDLREVIVGRAPWIADNPDQPSIEAVAPPRQPMKRREIAKLISIVIILVWIGVMCEGGPDALRKPLYQLMHILFGGVLIVYAIVNGRHAFSLFRERHFVTGLLWGAMAIFQVLFVLAIVGWFTAKQ